MVSKGFTPKVPAKTSWGLTIDQDLAKEMGDISRLARQIKDRLPKPTAPRRSPSFDRQLTAWYRNVFSRLERPWNVFPSDLLTLVERLEFAADFEPPQFIDPRRGDIGVLRECLAECDPPLFAAKEPVIVESGNSVYKKIDPPRSYVVASLASRPVIDRELVRDVLGIMKCKIGCWSTFFG